MLICLHICEKNSHQGTRLKTFKRTTAGCYFVWFFFCVCGLFVCGCFASLAFQTSRKAEKGRRGEWCGANLVHNIFGSSPCSATGFLCNSEKVKYKQISQSRKQSSPLKSESLDVLKCVTSRNSMLLGCRLTMSAALPLSFPKSKNGCVCSGPDIQV